MSAEAVSPVSEPPARPFEFVRDDGGRAEGINALFNRFTGRSRTAEQYHWEFYECPEPGAHVWAIVDTAGGRVVGHHGIVPTPLWVGDRVVAAGRTENTIIEPAVRAKIFYPGMEKKAFREALQSFAVLYTVHGSGAQGRIRERLGYRPVGRWNVFLPMVGRAYLRPLLIRLCGRVAPRLPNAVPAAAAAFVGAAAAVRRTLRRRPRGSECSEVVDLGGFEKEYRQFWEAARPGYDVTIDRSWEFLQWRVFGNPNLRFRVWAVRVAGRLEAVVIGHRHQLGAASALYVDDVLARSYEARGFRAALRWVPWLAPEADAVVLMTLDAATPLRAALRRQHPLQAIALDRLAPRVFDEMVAFDRDGACAGRPWYVTPLFTEGLDTSRPDDGASAALGF